jgi:hypothetical protein
MSKQKSRHSKEYSLYKNQEYLKDIAIATKYLSNTNLDNQIYQIIASKLVQFIKELDDTGFSQLPLMPKSILLEKLKVITSDVRVLITNRINRALTQLWENSFRLGIKHQILDLLYDSGLFEEEFKSLSRKHLAYSSLFGASISNYVLGDSDIASFAPGEDDKSISQAKRRDTVLRSNLAKLKASGVFKDKQLDPSYIPGRLNIEERITFFETAEDIANYRRKAEVLQKDFIGGNYISNRIRVLSSEYADKYDEGVKGHIYNYLTTNVEGTKQIKESFSNAELAAARIKRVLQEENVQELSTDQLKSKSKTILRTELNIAYNFGKLAGYSSREDLGRKFRVNADWELQGSVPGYEVCKFCSAVDGTIMTVRELLFLGIQADRGVLTYLGSNRTRTSFKNPSLLVIPFHPNCNCFYTVEPETKQEREDRLNALQTVPIKAGDAYSQEELTNLFQELSFDDTESTISSGLLATAGVGLVVGAGYLLSRSNVYKEFLKTIVTTIPKEEDTLTKVGTTLDDFLRQRQPQPKPSPSPIRKPSIVDDVVSSREYIKKEIPPEIGDIFENILTDVLSSSDIT